MTGPHAPSDHQSTTSLLASNRSTPYRPGMGLELKTSCKLPLHPETYPEGESGHFELRGALGTLLTPGHPSFLLLSTIISPPHLKSSAAVPPPYDHERAYTAREHNAALHEPGVRTASWIDLNVAAHLHIDGPTLKLLTFRITGALLSQMEHYTPWAYPLLFPRRVPSVLRYTPPSTTHPESLSLWLRLT